MLLVVCVFNHSNTPGTALLRSLCRRVLACPELGLHCTGEEMESLSEELDSALSNLCSLTPALPCSLRCGWALGRLKRDPLAWLDPFKPGCTSEPKALGLAAWFQYKNGRRGCAEVHYGDT